MSPLSQQALKQRVSAEEENLNPEPTRTIAAGCSYLRGQGGAGRGGQMKEMWFCRHLLLQEYLIVDTFSIL